MTVRPATLQDWALLYALRMDEAARVASVTPGPTSLREHLTWLTRTLQRQSVLILIGVDTTLPSSTSVGMVRLDCAGKRATVSIAVDARYRGRGYASALLDHAARIAPGRGVSVLAAHILTSNLASLRTFAAAAYAPKEHAEEDRVVILERRLAV